MCDPLSRNMPADLATILANCLARGRRQFADVAEYFPQGTCELGGFSPLDYFHQLVRHQDARARNPAAWLPWNYRQNVESLSNSRPSPTAAALES
jgi:hypothetical protein